MKKSSIYFCIIVLLASCEESNEANLLVTTKHNGHAIGQAMVYLKAGSNVDPNLPLSDYDFVQRSDGTGQAYFKDLDHVDYYVHAEGYDSQEQNQKISGGVQVTLKISTRNRTTEVTINSN